MEHLLMSRGQFYTTRVWQNCTKNKLYSGIICPNTLIYMVPLTGISCPNSSICGPIWLVYVVPFLVYVVPFLVYVVPFGGICCPLPSICGPPPSWYMLSPSWYMLSPTWYI